MAMKKSLNEKERQATPVDADELRDTLDVSEPPARKRTPVSRLLLLLLLLLVTAAGGYFYLLDLPGEEPPPPAPVRAAVPVKQPIPIPAAAPAAATAVPAPPAADAATAGKPAETAAPPAPAAGSPTEAAAPAPAPPAAAAPASAAPKGAQSASPAPPAAAPAGKYHLDAGAYLVRANRLQTEKIIRRLGYEPQAAPVRRTLEMVRLRVGIFAPEEARVQLRDISAVVPDAFTLPQGTQVGLYAGSYFDLDKARSYADRLYQQGIRVEEETAQVPMTLQLLTFGSFDDQASAGEAAARAREAGLEVTVRRR